MKYTGVTARGIVSPIFSQGDDLITMVCDALLAAAQNEGFAIDDDDIIGITESVVARTQGNYATCAQIAQDVRAKFGGGTLGLVFPILSRNRFSILLKAIAQGCEKLVVQLSYPADEVGNTLVGWDMLDAHDVDPWRDNFDEAAFRAIFGDEILHPFTGVDYIEFYKSFGKHIDIVFSNDPAHILQFAQNVLCCDIHTRQRTKRILKAKGAAKVLGLDDILTTGVQGSGYNPEYGLLGSNMATEDSVKLFPRDCQAVVDGVCAQIEQRTGKSVQALIYGDGCFKDPVGGIWEFADPVVAPAYTEKLAGTPSELKIKYFADNQLRGLAGEELAAAMRRQVQEKDANLVGNMAAQGTTPRRYIDLVGSLCDLTSGSGDRGTPIIHIKNYFS
ncbi:coenzyme F420-0:L-glutamate ligase, partial [Ruminococcaceae bacterium OttesenSCG-928-O06]|nr:coenzyme F420-0:L-glutamate ligase [Ruminococcaceae bacterium OttesenSCG-928-O06]